MRFLSPQGETTHLTNRRRNATIFKVQKMNRCVFWVWRSLVACLNGVQEAGSSNLLTQTNLIDKLLPELVNFFIT